ncbi:MAG: AAA family ATPase [Bacteroidota bacterium]
MNNKTENFKFRDLKVYSSTEWLTDNKKKYRQVFDRHDCTYIYAELSFYNKMFDRTDWEVDVELKCFSTRKGQKEICSLPFKRKVSKYDNIIYIREGWGNKKHGAFWKKGTFYWEAWIEGEKVGTKYFYVEDAGKNLENEENAFVKLKSIKLYEGPYDDVPEPERVYYRKFSGSETRYIYTEILLENINFGKSWQCELFVKFHNNAKELKGMVTRLQRVDKDDALISITAGWGSNVKGSWRHDKYTVDIIFIDRLIASVPFEVQEDFEEGLAGVLLPDKLTPVTMATEYEGDESFEDVMVHLDNLIGLSDIKQQVRDHAQYIQFLQLRQEKGFEETEEVNIHSVFIGNPGTGKTTVAKMMGKLYKKMGLLSKGHVHEVDRVDLIGEYIGQTAPKVKEAIDKARGGVLFIDEAYSLARTNDDSKDFGREVIEILVKEMSDGAGDMAVIVAGYPKEMQHFLDSNPGLKSRFKIYFEFSDYLPQELSQIATFSAVAKNVTLAKTAKKKIDELITEAYRNRDRTFGNARFVNDIIEQAKVHLGLRVMKGENPRDLSEDELSIIEMVDVENIEIQPKRRLPKIPVDERLLEQAMEELNHLIGMENIKGQIEELVQLVRFYRETGRNVLNKFFLHTVFIGNPGTGKTTVARILTKIYKALGVLERGHMVETDRQGLVAGYIGQTAMKTAEKIEEAMGGVLFIDEAYALSQSTGPTGDYGNEAIQTLIKRMEDSRGEFFVFVAGYPENMDGFLKTNPGLRSRFDKLLKFEDYSAEELFEIAMLMLDEEELEASDEAKEHLQKYLAFQYQYRDKYFGNARSVRHIITEAVKNQSLRLSSLSKKQRTKTMIRTLTYDDVKSFKLDKDADTIFTRKAIGFQKRAQGGGAK